MRGSIKVKDHWQNITLSEDPQTLSDWLWAHDGRDAVCIDDKRQVYYCATEELREKYQKGGKKADMFWTLEMKLRARLSSVTPAPESSPLWCAEERVLCSEIGACGGGCK